MSLVTWVWWADDGAMHTTTRPRFIALAMRRLNHELFGRPSPSEQALDGLPASVRYRRS